MIQQTRSKKSHPAITSDHWHVVHARWSGGTPEEARFERSIVSEHEDRDAALAAARDLVQAITPEMRARPQDRRDQIFVRKPDYKSLVTAARVERRRR
jgi:hypothetical protein